MHGHLNVKLYTVLYNRHPTFLKHPQAIFGNSISSTFHISHITYFNRSKQLGNFSNAPIFVIFETNTLNNKMGS